MATIGKPPRSLLDRFVESIKLADNGCWEWTGTKNHAGYGVITERLGYLKHRQLKAARFAYETFVGDVPVDPALAMKPQEITVDHICHNPACVRPDHLRLLTRSENCQDGFPRIAKARTHCPKGHPYDDKNTQIRKLPNGRFGRACRECKRLSCLAYYYRDHGSAKTDAPRSLPFKKRGIA